MTAEAETLPKAGPPPKRRIRNFLLDKPFQLKYTGMVVGVTVVVASVLGYFAYGYSVELTKSTTSDELMGMMVPEAQELMIESTAETDRNVLLGIIGGILVLAVSLGITGIMVTHKIVGPAYKLRRLLGDVADGELKIKGRLRKGDELQHVFLAFERMVEALRERQAEEIRQLDAAIKTAREAGTPEDALMDIVAVRDRMQAELD